LGHGGACLALGGRLAEIGAFYVNCDYANLSGLGVRLVALGGPLISLLTGVIGLLVLHRLPITAFRAKYFIWLFSSIGLMTATGYLLFSGITGIGDFGTSQDGMLYQATPAWAWQVGLTLLGLVSYLWVAIILAHAMDRIIGGTDVERIRRARLLALTSYLTGGVVSVLIGLLNPLGIFIVLASSAAGSLGGTAALLWMMQFLNRKATSPAPLLQITRDWRWIAVGIIVTVLYAVILGPSLHP